MNNCFVSWTLPLAVSFRMCTRFGRHQLEFHTMTVLFKTAARDEKYICRRLPRSLLANASVYIFYLKKYSHPFWKSCNMKYSLNYKIQCKKSQCISASKRVSNNFSTLYIDLFFDQDSYEWAKVSCLIHVSICSSAVWVHGEIVTEKCMRAAT